MLKLYGFPVSNYVNMVEVALIEKGTPYEYVLTFPDQSDRLLAMSPRGKVPCLETRNGFLSEASVILDYLEDSGEGKPLLPTEPYARARVRSLMKEIELYIELPARACFGEAFFGGTVPDAIKAKARDELIAGFAALKRHASFLPYVAGHEFSLADIVFFFSVDLAAGVAQRMFGLDLLADIPRAKSLLEKLGENPSVQKIVAAREAATPAFISAMKSRSTGS
ncbi:MAG: glutathione S-transferase [Burkholderiaceae bacterium]